MPSVCMALETLRIHAHWKGGDVKLTNTVKVCMTLETIRIQQYICTPIQYCLNTLLRGCPLGETYNSNP